MTDDQTNDNGDPTNQQTPPPPAPETDASLRRENERLKTQLDVREKQLRQAMDIAERANDERKAREEAEKGRLIQSIQMDGKFTKDELDGKTLDDLNTIRFTLDRSIEKTFANVAAEIDERKRKRQPLLTVGDWDPETKSWKGGIEV